MKGEVVVAETAEKDAIADVADDNNEETLEKNHVEIFLHGFKIYFNLLSR